MDFEVAVSSWKSINDMLIQNRCWICKHIFQKGKKKKVFMVSQILQVFKEITENNNKKKEKIEGKEEIEEGNIVDDRVKILTAFQNEAPYISLCWQSYQYYKGDNKKISEILDKADMQVWFSGLACTRNDLCSAIYNSLFLDNSREDQINSILALKGTFVKSAVCPPGCDCGWQFISISRPEASVENIQVDLIPASSSTIITTTTTDTNTNTTTTIKENLEVNEPNQNQSTQQQEQEQQRENESEKQIS